MGAGLCLGLGLGAVTPSHGGSRSRALGHMGLQHLVGHYPTPLHMSTYIHKICQPHAYVRGASTIPSSIHNHGKCHRHWV